MSSPNAHCSSYDVLIVGAGIAGSAFAHALSTAASTSRAAPLRIALLERSLAEPDRIVGELLQPGGVAALRSLGLGACLDHIDAIPVHGYAVLDAGQTVHIPYPSRAEGRSFHHGRFVQNLRARAREAPDVDLLEVTVTDLIECPLTRRVLGVRARRDGADHEVSFFADLVVVADGCFSNFRSAVMDGCALNKRAVVRGNFVGAVLEDVTLPIPKHGTVALVKGHGPVLLYQIGEHDTRILIDVKNPLPSDLKVSTTALCHLQSTCVRWQTHFTTNLCPVIESHPHQRRPPTPRIASCGHSQSAIQRPSPAHAKLIPPIRRAGRATLQRGRHPPWRRMEYAPSAHRRWHDCRPGGRRAPRADDRRRTRPH
jgi:2-polyprenyl-6-methoxyphenol hydroxylase-like FAD-dependent oxidoreductase